MTTFTFNLTADEVKLVGFALGQLPHDKVRRLIDSLQVQINEQNKEEEDTDVE